MAIIGMGNDPILHLIHTLGKTEIWHAYMGRHDLSNKRIVADNMKSVEKRKATVWQKMANMRYNEKFALMTMVDYGVITQVNDAVH